MTADQSADYVLDKHAREPVPVFVYGSLCVGGWNFDPYAGCVARVSENVTTKGRLWFAAPGSYPLAKFSESGETIHGQLLWCFPDSPLFRRMVDMEEGAGYEVRIIDVALKDGRTMKAFGFHYRFSTATRQPVPENNWLKWLASVS